MDNSVLDGNPNPKQKQKKTDIYDHSRVSLQYQLPSISQLSLMKLSTLCGLYWEYWLQAVWNNITSTTFKLHILLFASCQMSKLA